MWFLLFVVANALTPKFCIHCKHFMNQPSGPEYGKYRFFPIGVDYLVTGKSEYRYCSTARSFEDMCGKKGQH